MNRKLLHLEFIRNFIAIIFIGIFCYLGGHVFISKYDDYQKFAIPKDLTTGTNSYYGPCPEVVSNINRALSADRYLSHHLSSNGKQNLKFYKENILGYINGSFSEATSCSDVEAVGRLLYLASHITLDLCIDGGITYKEGVFLAKNYYTQANALGYGKMHPNQNNFLKYRLIRNQFRLDNKSDV